MRTTLPTLLTLCLAGGLLAAQPEDAARGKGAAELKKLHILLVFDTNDNKLAPGLERDEKRLAWLWANVIPRDRYTLKVIKGNAVTADAVLAQVRRLKLGKDEGVLFFYGGHGAIDPKKGHHFQLTKGRSLLRGEVLKALEGTGAGLTALVSDCCSTVHKAKGVTPRALPKVIVPAAIHPPVRDLFFRARGLVDVTGASKDEASWGDIRGGLFTRAFVKMLMLPLGDLDSNKDGALSWAEFFPQLRTDTKILFDALARDARGAGDPLPARTQTPFAFKLGAVGAAATARASYAVVAFENASGKPLKYKWRWAGQTAWTSVVLKDGERKVHSLALKGQAAPKFEAQFEGFEDGATQRLEAKKWAGVGPPTFADAKGAQYRFGATKD